jgi:2-polyprenyl-6-hydroxyphenyl methylase/3-demethylubiquinone-9 3-methyltransferase
VLDVGSGTGWFSESAARRGGVVVSVDIGPRLLLRTRARCGSAPVAADACRLPFATSVFDVVISSECIEHTLEPLQAVAEMARVVRRGGLLVLTTPNWLWRWSATVANTLALRPYEGYEHWVSRRQVKETLRANGLLVQAVRGFHLVPPLLRATWPMLRRVDRHGQWLSPLMLNYAVKATKS